jgi:hypothetical protein
MPFYLRSLNSQLNLDLAKNYQIVKCNLIGKRETPYKHVAKSEIKFYITLKHVGFAN